MGAGNDSRSRLRLRGRAAWAGTLLAGPDLAREGDVALIREGAFTPIHVRPAAGDAMAATERIAADERVAA